MNLIPEPTQPGLWTNRDWQPGSPGAFAVIIGVSQYDHLAGGKPGEMASETFGLGQLGVSAYTAYAFFSWLRDAYRYGGAALARCWLLLAPTPAELAHEPKLGEHCLSPTLQHCEDAIGAWYATMKGLDDQSAAKSRSFFFFSGHGLQVTEDCQILLPQDYLRPPAENVNRALSTQNLANGVKPLKTPHHFFFLDACRNDHNNLGKVASLDGFPVLNVLKSSFNNPDCFVPLFYASASATQAWQPPDPSYGLSIFGQALLEGLRAQAGMTPNCTSDPCVVNLDLLTPFVTRRVNAIMQTYNATVGQRIRLRGDWTEEPITEVDYEPTLAPPPAQMETAVPFEVHTPPPGWRPGAEGYADAHDILGSENMSDIWIYGTRLCALPQANPQAPRWLSPGKDFIVHQVERHETRTYRIELSVAGAQNRHGRYWLQLTDRLNRSFACVLPGDRFTRPRYLLELDLAYPDTPGDPRPLVRMEAGLALANQGVLQDAAFLWQLYENVSAREAAGAAAMEHLTEMLRTGVDSPLAAVVAGLILIRLRSWPQLRLGLYDLAHRYAYLPDGPILWVEQLLGQSTQDLLSAGADDSFMVAHAAKAGKGVGRSRQIIDYLLALDSRGLPTTSEALSYAVRQTGMFLQYGEGLTPAQRDSLERMQTRLHGALRYFRSGGLFSVFAGPAEEIHPGLVQ